MSTNQLDNLRKLLSQSTPEQKATILAELARDVLNTTAPGQSVPVQDAQGKVVARLAPEPEYIEIPADDSTPEFWEAIRRRCETEPTMTADEFLRALKSLH